MPDISELIGYIIGATRYLMPLLALWVVARCVRSMLRERYEPETWAYLVDLNGERHPVNHWECIIGRSRSADVELDSPSVSRVACLAAARRRRLLDALRPAQQGRNLHQRRRD